MGVDFVIAESGKSLWPPATTVGRLYMGQIEVLENLFGLECGITENIHDTHEIDLAKFEKFVVGCIAQLSRTTHRETFRMIHGCMALSIGLVAKATGRWPEVPAGHAPLEGILREARTVHINYDGTWHHEGWNPIL